MEGHYHGALVSWHTEGMLKFFDVNTINLAWTNLARNFSTWTGKSFEEITRDAPTAREKLVAFFKSLQEYVMTPACYGCPFLNVATEYPKTDYPGHEVAIKHKQSVRQRFYQLAKEAGAKKPDVLADQLFLLMDGAYMASRMFGSKNPAAHLAEAAQVLINSACG